MSEQLEKKDLDSLRERGLTEKDLTSYRETILHGFPYMKLHGNAVAGSGIKLISKEEKEKFRSVYQNREDIEVVKFVPASGAASRMFRELYAYTESGKATDNVAKFLAELSDYPFYNQLLEEAKMSEEDLDSEEGKRKAVEFLLSEEGMNYGSYPKGMIKFHRYDDGHKRTAFEEHFHEGAMYAQKDGKVRIHFTIPEETADDVKQHLQSLEGCIGKMHNVEYLIDTSLQKPSTDTPALYADDHDWVRVEDGSLLFRPAGHGALLENLNDLVGDVVFVKNIDNVVPDRLKDITVENKELLAGVLLEVQEKLFQFCRDYENDNFSREDVMDFLNQWFVGDFESQTEQDLYNFLNRPLRVCGMVKNEGEPGGGPFLVDENGDLPSLQIVESAQIDPDSEEQQAILSKASHFNPVDLVLSLKNHKGDYFDLMEYRNDNSGMVVDKTFQGRDIKALELPGLWNGAMHDWNTIFVEVPIETFNPVKTVFDLRRPNHC
ncbi:MAG TPA: DUF4301 family protein [Cryomorphaceae bacterium]|nr:DUF4301 family protein [Cryomorphaceae bacterium]